jgi:hypothetical protein
MSAVATDNILLTSSSVTVEAREGGSTSANSASRLWRSARGPVRVTVARAPVRVGGEGGGGVVA